MLSYILIAIGGALGSVARFWFSGLVGRHYGETFPWGTLFVNVSGSFVIGLFFTLTEPEGSWLVRPSWRGFVMFGICGGYTTFSTFGYETMRLVQLGRPAGALAYVLASNLLGFGAVLLGSWVAR